MNISQNHTARQIVELLDQHIIGQEKAKKAVARAIRERWRRMQLSEELRKEVSPKNILMVGPTGIGKTEIARRLASIISAPFIKVEATKFTEVGYVGRDVEQIIRDLVESTLSKTKEEQKKIVENQTQQKVEGILLQSIHNTYGGETTELRYKLQNGICEKWEIEIELRRKKSSFSFDPHGDMGVISLSGLNDMMSKVLAEDKKKKRNITVEEARKQLLSEESEKLIDKDKIVEDVIFNVEQKGIVFIDEIDKICMKGHRNQDISREGVQRDLLPLIEGTSVTTKYGTVNTKNILFIASGAFHMAKPSDLMAELQGRLPVRVDMSHLSAEDFYKILTKTKTNLLVQNQSLLATEGVNIEFKDDGIKEISQYAYNLNISVENIGARRLYTVMENILSEVAFAGSELSGQTIVIDKEYVKTRLNRLQDKLKLNKYIL